MKKTGQKGTFILLTASAFSAVLGIGIISPFLPEFVKQYQANGFWLGMIFAGFGVSRGLITPFIGSLSDTYGRKIFVSTGLFLFAIISLLYPTAHKVYSLTIIRILHGFSAGLIMPVVIAYIGDIAQEGKHGITTASLNMMFYIGLALGPFMGGFLAEYYGFSSVFYAMAALTGFIFLIVLFFLPESVAHHHEHKTNLRMLNIIMKHQYIKAVLFITVMVTLMISVFMSFMPSVAVKDHVDAEHIGIIISIGILTAGLLQIPFGIFSDRLDKFGKMMQTALGASIGMTGLFIVPFCPDFKALIFTGVILGLGIAISAPAILSISIDIGKKTRMGLWMGIVGTARSLGFVLTPVIFGVLMDHLGIDSVFYMFGIFAFLGITISVNLLNKKIRSASP